MHTPMWVLAAGVTVLTTSRPVTPLQPRTSSIIHGRSRALHSAHSARPTRPLSTPFAPRRTSVVLADVTQGASVVQSAAVALGGLSIAAVGYVFAGETMDPSKVFGGEEKDGGANGSSERKPGY